MPNDETVPETTTAKGHPCPQPVATAISNLRTELHAAYGFDFAFTVYGHGLVIGASNAKHGEVEPLPR